MSVMLASDLFCAMFLVPSMHIKKAIDDFQKIERSFQSSIISCTWIEQEHAFAVLVGMNLQYPDMVKTWREKWENV